jgi:hypothetical protein
MDDAPQDILTPPVHTSSNFVLITVPAPVQPVFASGNASTRTIFVERRGIVVGSETHNLVNEPLWDSTHGILALQG